MAKRRRGLFQRDLGRHPPPIQDFLNEWHRTDYRSGRIRWGLWQKISLDEIRSNQRSVGRGLVGFSIALPALLCGIARATGKPWSSVAGVSIVVFVGCGLAGLMLIRAGRRR